MLEKPLIRVVDDDLAVREALLYMLRLEGWDVITFNSASDFLRGDIPSRFGVVILDVRMPTMSGLSLQEELIKRNYANPIVFLSGHGDIEMAVQTVKKGAVNFLQKPINPENLIQVIRESLQGSVRAEDEMDLEALSSTLTRREIEIAALVVQGLSNRDMAERFGISVRTLEHQRETLYRKLGVNSKEALLAKVGNAFHHG